MEKQTTEAKDTTVKKKRKTLDEVLGINGLLIFAIISTFFIGSIIGSIGTIAGFSAVFYLIKRRKTLTQKNKRIGWILVIVWQIIFIIINTLLANSNL